jgi:hypothetical protein
VFSLTIPLSLLPSNFTSILTFIHIIVPPTFPQSFSLLSPTQILSRRLRHA